MVSPESVSVSVVSDTRVVDALALSICVSMTEDRPCIGDICLLWVGHISVSVREQLGRFTLKMLDAEVSEDSWLFTRGGWAIPP